MVALAGARHTGPTSLPLFALILFFTDLHMTSAFIYDTQHGQFSTFDQCKRALASIPARLSLWQKAGRSAVHVDGVALDVRALDAIAPPQDALSRHAWQLGQATQPPWLVQHALRTYAWGQLLALQGDLRPDRSVLFAACMLHDVGLTPHADSPPDHCFAVRGARYARQHLRAHAGPTQSLTVANAISLHMDLRVGPEQGLEAHLLQAGAGVDVVGRRLRAIPAPVRKAVLERHPRMGMKQALCQCMRLEADRAPRTRLGLYTKRLGFLQLIEKAPFAE